MKSGFLLVLGLFAALAVSWGGLVLGSHAQLGGLAPYYDEAESNSFPARASGLAARGQHVYADLGCATCHTQQVRAPEFGSDKARGWGDRQSVARDYIFQSRPQIGASRFGPDLANLAARKPAAPTTDDLMKLLYAGSPTHPAYKFLFEERAIVGQRSDVALSFAAALGREIVPTERAQTLVAYLLSLSNPYVYPEARPVVVPAAAGHGAAPAHGAAPVKHDEKAAVPAAKKEEAKK